MVYHVHTVSLESILQYIHLVLLMVPYFGYMIHTATQYYHPRYAGASQVNIYVQTKLRSWEHIRGSTGMIRNTCLLLCYYDPHDAASKNQTYVIINFVFIIILFANQQPRNLSALFRPQAMVF